MKFWTLKRLKPDTNVEVPISNRICVPFLVILINNYFNNEVLDSEMPTLL